MRIRVWSSACGKRGKWGYLAREDALEAFRNIRKRQQRGEHFRSHRKEQSVYLCDQCGRWHLSSWPPGKKKAVRRN